MDFASISDPFQQANFAIYQGAGNLARGVGGLLGAQDPELMRVRQRQEMLQGVNPADPASLLQAAQRAAKANDFPAAQELSRRAQEIQKTQAQIGRDQAATTASTVTAAAGRLTTEQRNAAALADTAVPNREDPKWAETYNAQLMRLTSKEDKPFSFGAEAERVSQELYKKPFSQLTQTEMAAVNKRVDESKERSAPRIIMPGQQVPQKDWLDFVSYLDKNPVFKQSTSIISAAPSALETIRMSTSNDIAAVAIGPQLARMAGETGALSAQDVNRWAKAGGLDDRLIGSAVSFFSGRLTQAKKAEAEKYVTAVFRGALLEQKRQLENNAEEFGYSTSPNYKARLKNVNTQLERFKRPSDQPKPDQPKPDQPKPGQPRLTGDPLVDKYLGTTP
jgi:hypothetical protein